MNTEEIPLCPIAIRAAIWQNEAMTNTAATELASLISEANAQGLTEVASPDDYASAAVAAGHTPQEFAQLFGLTMPAKPAYRLICSSCRDRDNEVGWMGAGQDFLTQAEAVDAESRHHAAHHQWEYRMLLDDPTWVEEIATGRVVSRGGVMGGGHNYEMDDEDFGIFNG